MSTSGKVWQILKEPLPLFRFPNDEDYAKNHTLRIPPARQGTTAIWAGKFAAKLKLKETQWEWQTGGDFAEFEQEIQKYDDELAPKSIPDTPFHYPRTEGDIAVAVEYQLVNPVWHIARQWLPKPSGFTHNFRWGLEVLNEAYSKKDAVVNSAGGPSQSSAVRIHIQNASIDAQPTEIPRESAVRVDKVMVLGLHGVSEGRSLRAQSQARAQLAEVLSANQYLKRDEIWGRLIGCTQDEESKRLIENRIQKKDHVKGLVPIEIKDHGYINEKALNVIAASGTAIGGSDRTQRGDLPITGTRAILQQAIRYGMHYGTNYVFVSHYNFSLLLGIDKIEKQTIDWAIIPGKDARVALAFVTWLACKKLKSELAQFQMDEGRMKRDVGQGR